MRFERLAAAALLALGCTACGPEPGDYWVFRVSKTQPALSEGCYFPDEEPGRDEVNDTNTFLISATFSIYAPAGDSTLLNDGDLSVPADEEAGGLTFTGVFHDVDIIGDEDDTESVVDTTVTYALETSGDAIGGTITTREAFQCNYLSPVPAQDLCPSPPRPDCVVTQTVSGVRLSDVQVTSSID